MLHMRDPFVRIEVHSNREYDHGNCHWCGQRRRTRSGRTWLYRFRIESDGGRTWEDNKLFCSRECRGFYYGD